MTMLPRRIDYAVLKSFWIVLCVFAFSLAALLPAWLSGSPGFLWILVAAPVAVAAGLRYTERLARPYRLFRAVLRRVVGLLRELSLAIVDRILVPCVRLSGAMPLDRQRPPDSTWTVKEMVDLKGRSAGGSVSVDDSPRHLWAGSLAMWLVRTGRWRLLPILPWLVILAFLYEPADRQKVAAHTYTLY